MGSTDSPGPTELTADIQLKVGQHRLSAKIAVSTGPTQLMHLLPVVQPIVDLAGGGTTYLGFGERIARATGIRNR